MLSGFLKNSLVITVGLFVLFSCRNKCRDVDCVEHAVLLYVSNYDEIKSKDSSLFKNESSIDSNLVIKDLNRSYYIYNMTRNTFSIFTNSSGYSQVFYKDTLKYTINYDPVFVETECCSYFKYENLKVNGELKCTNDCSSSSVYNVEF